MPKEVTHWLVAEETARSLKGTPAGMAALTCPNSRALGAIYPDVLFYAAGEAQILAHYYHGLEGRDTNYLLRQTATRLNSTDNRDGWLSFLVGLVSHVVTDQVFHPLVYYLTGNYEDQNPESRARAIISHRTFECLLDLFFLDRESLAKVKLKKMVSLLELPLPEVAGLDPSASHEFTRALKRFIFMQGAFANPFYLRLLSLFTPLFPPSWQKISALFYHYSLDHLVPSLQSPLSYRHPITGQEEVASINELFARAVKETKKKVEEAMEAISKGKAVFPERGSSLSFGMDGEPLFFAPQPFGGGRK